MLMECIGVDIGTRGFNSMLSRESLGRFYLSLRNELPFGFFLPLVVSNILSPLFVPY